MILRFGRIGLPVILAFTALFTLALRADDAPAVSPNLVPLNDNTAPPHLGIYEGLPKEGIPDMDQYAKLLNRTLIWGHISEGWNQWDDIEHAHWLYPPWAAWAAAMPGRRMVLSIPLMPWSPKAGPPYTLAEGAAGKYNSHFAVLAQTLVDNKIGNSIIRLGWEFDGGWYPWKTKTQDNAANYAKFFHQVVTTMRAVPGAEKLEFCWNSAGEDDKYELAECYPGDDVVDYVGLDIYDKSWAHGTYPYPPNATAEQKADIQKAAWTYLYGNKRGIKVWIDFAKAHNKPFFIPEWGLMHDKKGHGGEDDPSFVQNMYNLIHDPANNVYEAAYWDAKDCKLMPTGATPALFPDSWALYQKLFSLPAPPPAPVTPSAPSSPPSAPAAAPAASLPPVQ